MCGGHAVMCTCVPWLYLEDDDCHLDIVQQRHDYAVYHFYCCPVHEGRETRITSRTTSTGCNSQRTIPYHLYIFRQLQLMT